MFPNCSADLVQVLSPVREGHEDPWIDDETHSVLERRPRATVDDKFLFRRAIWSWHRRIVRRLRAVPPLLRFGVEVLLLLLVLLQISYLVILHSAVLPPAMSASGQVAQALTSALYTGHFSNVSRDATELLVVEVALPSRCGSSASGEREQVRCEFASDREVLKLPLEIRQSALLAAAEQSPGLTAVVTLPASDLDLDWPSHGTWARSILQRYVLSAMVAGPLREEVLRREPFFTTPNSTEGNASDLTTKSAKWSLLAWGLAEFGLGVGNASKAGSHALSYFSCEGESPMSLSALRRLAELVDRPMEWWLFKVVWLFSTAVLGLLVAVLQCYAVRTSLLGCYKLASFKTKSFLENLEAFVLVLSPLCLGVVFCSIMGDDAEDTAVILVGLSIGEVVSYVALHTEESRYLFPRTALPAYVANAYYAYFHPFGLTWLSHSCLYCYQAFLFLVLWSHFESTVALPSYSLDQLVVEVKLRPSRSQVAKFNLSPSVQKLLLEQGLLLLGDNTSYETGVVMSAVISRAVQNVKVPCVLRLTPAAGATDLLLEGERLELIHPEALGGGTAIHMLLNRAFAGDARCAAMLAQLLSRMRGDAPPDDAPPDDDSPVPTQEASSAESGRGGWRRPAHLPESPLPPGSRGHTQKMMEALRDPD
ncbi:unnamed protein product [Durusdinium trenchii]|uniref:Receptor for retinol uptake STRA6 n=1 Tax=Durusdinium trenchii TaxID=1381693 RepID=A0ABP0KJC2_9DINO